MALLINYLMRLVFNRMNFFVEGGRLYVYETSILITGLLLEVLIPWMDCHYAMNQQIKHAACKV